MKPLTNVLIYARSNGESHAADQAHLLLEDMPGVRRVRQGHTAANALLVDYDHEATSAQQILAGLRSRGVTASLVGM